MARSLPQLDAAVAQLETTVPRNYKGLLETLNQSNLATETQLQSLLTEVGSATDDQGNANPSGLYAVAATLQASLDALTLRVANLEIAVSSVVSAETANASGDTAAGQALATAQAGILSLDAAVSTLQTQVNSLLNP